MKIALAQMAPVWLNCAATLEKNQGVGANSFAITKSPAIADESAPT
jgi:hypothetical protein